MASAISALIGLSTALSISMLPLTLIIIGIGLAIVGIGIAVYYVIKYWQQVRTFFISLWQNVKDVFFQAFDFIVNLIKNSPIATYFKVMFAIAEAVIKTFAILLLTILEPVVNWFIKTWGSVSDFFSDTWLKIGGYFEKGIKKIEPLILIFNNTVNKIKEIWGGLATWFGDLFKTIGNSIVSGINFAIRYVNKNIESIEKGINFLIDGLNKLGEKFGIRIDKVNFGRFSEISTGNNMTNVNQNLIMSKIPNNNQPTNIYIDGRQIASSIAPYMVDSILTNKGVVY